ncbi:MAG: pyruvate formate lyase family protein, partial [Bacteroidales bacterium]
MANRIEFKQGKWNEGIDVKDFVQLNVTPYDGDASFLCGPTERTNKVWDLCKQALKEERENNGVRSIDTKRISTIISHPAGYIDQESETIVGLQTDAVLRR